MDLEFTRDQQSLRDSVRDILDKESPPTLARSVIQETGDGRALWAKLTELGWSAMSIPEDLGGLGLSAVEVGIVAEELGWHLTPSPFLATVTQFTPIVRALSSTDQQRQWLGAIAAGTCTGASAANAANGSPTVTDLPVTARHVDAGYELAGVARFVMDGASADLVAVAAQVEDAGLGVFVVEQHEVSSRQLGVVDPTMPVADIDVEGVVVCADRLLGGNSDAAALVLDACDEACAALALSVVGTCDASWSINLEYAKDRYQFGVPIGSFQAVKHTLADMYVAVERARALGYFAMVAIAEHDPRRAFAAAAAKAAAGECQRLCVQDGIQLFGAIGFTWEHDMHLFVRHAKSADALLGNAQFHRSRVADLMDL